MLSMLTSTSYHASGCSAPELVWVELFLPGYQKRESHQPELAQNRRKNANGGVYFGSHIKDQCFFNLYASFYLL
jgi:hypothetical protein